MTIRQKESEQVAPYSASFQRTMISAILKAEDGGVSQVGLMYAAGADAEYHYRATAAKPCH